MNSLIRGHSGVRLVFFAFISSSVIEMSALGGSLSKK